MRKFNVNVNGKSYAVEVEEIVDGSVSVPVAQPVVDAPVAKVAKASVVTDGEPVKVQMPGLVKKLCFSNGTQVKEGDTIVILEAMKMDTPIAAPKSGVITYSTSEGANIDSGTVVATIA
jgi:glutaconyl-CoA/methylmalonyl-CoA decarboxylase subunit gamma